MEGRGRANETKSGWTRRNDYGPNYEHDSGPRLWIGWSWLHGLDETDSVQSSHARPFVKRCAFYLNCHGWSLVVTPSGNTGAIALLFGLASHGRTDPIVRFMASLSRRSDRVHWTLENNEWPAMFWTVDCWAGYGCFPCLRAPFTTVLPCLPLACSGMYLPWPRTAHDDHRKTKPRVVSRRAPLKNAGTSFGNIKGPEYRA